MEALRRVETPRLALVPVVADDALEQNGPSRRVAERVGLINRGPRVDPDDGRVRLAYSDRPLD